MKKFYLALFLTSIQLLTFSGNAISQKSYKISSPDKHTQIEVGTDERGNLGYRALFLNQEIITWSDLGFVINEISAGKNTLINKTNQRTVNERYSWPIGENDSIVNHFNEYDLSCQTGAFRFNFTVRVFNNAIAFQYNFPKQKSFESAIISREMTEYNLTDNYTIYQYNRESVFTPMSLDSFSMHCDLPATLTNGKRYISISEAANDNFTKIELKRGRISHSLMVDFVTEKLVKSEGDFHSPWRTISFSNTAVGLYLNSELNLKLCSSSPAEIPEWVKPGKMMRIMKLDTEAALECIDFAVKNNLSYVLYDGGWYNVKEFDSNKAYITPISAINMQKVISYGKRKNIGVVLYVNYSQGLVERLDSTLYQFKVWGAAGIKPGFVDGCTQKGIQWLVSAVQKMQSMGFVMNVHDSYKPTGLSWTYPALLTQEGIRGDENGPDAFHNMVLPYTRFLAGPADFTFCYPNGANKYAKQLKVSMAQQLALSVIYFSPLQVVFWYGRPGDYTKDVEIDFFKNVPTVWNESHYLAGEIGKNICVARRSGSTWFMGIGTGLDSWRSKIKLNFLATGVNYVATIYEDCKNESIATRIINVKKGDDFQIDLQAKAGQAVIISVKK